MVKDALNLKWVIAFVCSDVDIKLLQNKEQTADNDKETFTRKEIRQQLIKSGQGLATVLREVGFDLNKPLELDNPFKQLFLDHE